MTPIDKLIRTLRINKAVEKIQDNARILDIGCFDGSLFKVLGKRLGEGVGVDPLLPKKFSTHSYHLLPISFPSSQLKEEKFDVITLLAVIEHVPAGLLGKFAESCYQLLREGGNLIITVPSPYVDPILRVLIFLKLAEGIAFEEHHGFDQKQTSQIFTSCGFKLVSHEKFELGLNNLYIFHKPITVKEPCFPSPGIRISSSK